MIFRALDYLPPGEVSFADYGRAIVAADQASHPDDANERNALTKEFVRRGIVSDESALHVQTNYDEPAVAALDLATLVESDWAAYEFANTNRPLLGIPDRIHFRVRPRLDTTKTYYRRGARGKSEQVAIRECIFKVSWDHPEPNNAGAALPKFRQITVGTTLAIDWEIRKVRAKLTADYGAADQRDARDALLRRLNDDGVLQIGDAGIGPDGKPLGGAVHGEVMGDLMRVRGLARMLHINAGDRS
jgi:hypothetical protein